MSKLTLKKEGQVYVLTMINGVRANTIAADFIQSFHEALDQIEGDIDNKISLVITSNDPKFWSNGIDLDWLNTQPHTYFDEFKGILDKLLLRLVLLNAPTIGCLNGHAFGGGAILSCTLDFRFMRSDRGFFCFPEVDLGIPFTPLMHEVIDLLPDKQALNDLVFTGRRIGGDEAKSLKIVNDSFPAETLLAKTMAFAEVLAQKDRATYTMIKHGLRRDLVALRNRSK